MDPVLKFPHAVLQPKKPTAPRRRTKGEGTVTFNAKSGRFMAQYSRGEVDGKRVRKTWYGTTAAEAAGKMRAWLRGDDSTLPVNAEGATLLQCVEGWGAEIKASVRDSTWDRAYEAKVRRHILPALGPMPLVDITPARVHAALMAAKRPDKKPLSPRSRQMCWNIISATLDWAVANSLLVQNPLRRPGVRGVRVPKKQMQIWSPEEMQKFQDGTKAGRPQFWALWTMLMRAGLRLSEALGLQWSDISDGGVVTVQYQLVEGKRSPYLKTDNSYRAFRLPAVVQEALARLPKTGAWVFQTSTGTAFGQRNTLRAFDRAVEKLGMRAIRIHDLRHSAACHMLNVDRRVHVVAQVLGHTPEVLLRTYAHVLKQDSAELTDAMDAALSTANPTANAPPLQPACPAEGRKNDE